MARKCFRISSREYPSGSTNTYICADSIGFSFYGGLGFANYQLIINGSLTGRYFEGIGFEEVARSFCVDCEDPPALPSVCTTLVEPCPPTAAPLLVFNFRVDANNAVRTNTYRTKSVQFGDGYKQLAPAGINNKRVTWALSLPLVTSLVTKLIEDFFDIVGQHKTFIWTSPSGIKGVYRLIEKVEYQASGLDGYATRTTIKLSFEWIYDIQVIGILPIIKVIPLINIGWNIYRTGSTGASITIYYTILSTSTAGTLNVTSGSIVILAGSGIAFVPALLGISIATELLIVTTNSTYIKECTS